MDKEKQDKIKAETETDVVKASMKAALDRENKLIQELTEVRNKLAETADAKISASNHLNEVQKKYEESQTENIRLESIKKTLNETINQLEESKNILETETDQLRIKIRDLENAHLELNHDFESQRARLDQFQGIISFQFQLIRTTLLLFEKNDC